MRIMRGIRGMRGSMRSMKSMRDMRGSMRGTQRINTRTLKSMTMLAETSPMRGGMTRLTL